MLRLPYVAALVLLGVSNALAGTVTFTPLGSTFIFDWQPPTSVDFRIGISNDFEQGFDVTALSATLDVLPVYAASAITFTFSDEFGSQF